ncbi:hypothetical protein RHSIM_Rhsim05G0112700 [Rhododendron simsii]|uniref:RNase H type-1 domain-containing protein n=1 Tax=Rhododendron simsii TaxID=118357 RepID=A0A834LP31_RHOSS|nr:hypothetical protein RHSIM_Rhsim05G0112700 [Rhododendron simsii]
MATPTESQSSLQASKPTIPNIDDIEQQQRTTKPSGLEVEVIDYSSRAQWLRATILGANDGLLSTASLMVGVGAIQKDLKTIMLAGIAGLVAGACSMAIGEFVSVYSQYDIEMAQIMRDVTRGTTGDVIISASEIEKRKRKLPSPFKAAMASAAAFALGAFVPLLAAAFIKEDYYVRLGAVVAAVSLALIGFGGVSAVLGRARVVKPSLRVLVGGWLAMGVTFSLTKLDSNPCVTNLARPVGPLYLSSLSPKSSSSQMASKKVQATSINKNTSKNATVAKNSGSTSTGPATRSKAKATVIITDQGAKPKVNPAKVPLGKRQGVATLAAKKEEEGSEKLPSNSESSMSASSPLPTHSVSDADSSTGSHSGSSPSSPKSLGSPIQSDASYSMAMQAMATDAATVEEQLATMARAIEKLTKTVEDKDLQIASLMNKLEAQNMEGTSHDASHPPGFTPKGVIIADESGKLMMGDPTGKLKQADDGNHVLSSNQRRAVETSKNKILLDLDEAAESNHTTTIVVGSQDSPTSGSKAKGEHVATPTAIARTLQFGSLEPMIVQDLSQEISTFSCLDKNPSAEIDEGWIVVTRKKSCKNKPKAKSVSPTKAQGKRNHHQYSRRKGGKKMKAKKEVLEVCEPVGQNPLTPITLQDFFPKGYFKEEEVEAVYMVSTSEEIDGNVEQVHTLKASMDKEEADLLTTLNEAPPRFSVREASQLSQSARLALIQVLEDPIEKRNKPQQRIHKKMQEIVRNHQELSHEKDLHLLKTQAAEKSFRYIPKSRRKEGQSPFEEVITKGNPAKCSQALCKEDLRMLKGDLTTPLPTLGQPSSTKLPLKGFVKSTQSPLQHTPLPEKRTDGFDPKAYKLLSNSGYDFNNPTPLGELSPELTGEKVHGLSKAQEELRRQGYRVSPPKIGLGFTPPKPILISAKGKGKKANAQHITVEEVKEDDNEQAAPRISVFDRIEASIPRTSVFNRLGVTKEMCEGATLQPKKSIFSRLGNRSASSRENNFERKEKSVELDSAKEDEEARSSIPSRMKRITSLEINAEGPLKVKRRTIILTGQPKGHERAEKEDEMEYTTSYHVTVEEHSKSDSEDDDFPEAPPELEDGGQPTVDDLKELNLGTPDEPRPIFVSALLSPEEEKAYFDLLFEYRDVFAWTYKEMPGLSPKVAVHHLGIRHGARPLCGDYEVRKDDLVPYFQYASHLLKNLEGVTLEHVPREENRMADALANLATTLALQGVENVNVHVCEQWILPQLLDCRFEEANAITVLPIEDNDWRQPLIDYLQHGKLPNDRRHRAEIRRRAPRFIFFKDTLFHRSFEVSFSAVLGKKNPNKQWKNPILGSVGHINLEDLTDEENAKLRLAELETLDEKRLEAQQQLECYQARISKAFNKKVKPRSFKFGDLVLALRRPIITNRRTRNKFLSKWDGPYVVVEVYNSGAYKIADEQGFRIGPINGKFLKRYYP